MASNSRIVRPPRFTKLSELCGVEERDFLQVEEHLQHWLGVDASPEHGKTTLAEALFLMAYAQGNRPTGWTILMQAAYDDVWDAIHGLVLDPVANIEVWNHEGETALIIAAKGGNMRTCSVLLEVGADVDGRGVDGRSPLHYASRGTGEHQYLCKTMEVLIMAGADINALDYKGCTPLHEACATGNRNCETLLLLRSNAIPTIPDMWGATPLHVVCGSRGHVMSASGHVTIAGMLVVCGADPCVSDKHDDMSMHLVYDTSLYGFEVVQRMLKYSPGPYISIPDKNGNTLLHKTRGDVVSFKWLLDHHANVETQNKDGNTPLHILAKGVDSFIYDGEASEGILSIQLLIEMGVSTEILNNEGLTPREVANRVMNDDVIHLIDTVVSPPIPLSALVGTSPQIV
jgi:ankyrin repeat protein